MTFPGNPRVFITGVGLLAPTGATPEACFQALLSGTAGLSFESALGLPVGRLEPEAQQRVAAVGARRSARRLDGTALMAIAAAEAAMSSAGSPDPTSAGVILGTSRGAAVSLEKYHSQFLETSRPSASMSPVTTGATLSSAVASALSCRGPVFTLSAACQSGLTALGTAFGLIQSGQADQFIAGGSESCLTPFTLGSLDQLGLLSHSTAPYPLRPGEPDRDGTVLSEGAALFLLESERSLADRRGIALAEIVGFAHASEAASLTGVSQRGEALQRCISRVIERDQPAVVVGHLPGTQAGDAAEGSALRSRLAGGTPVTGFKWSTGHMLGASPAFSAAMALECMRRDCVPGLACASAGNILPGICRSNRSLKVATILITATGFGGNAAAMLLRKV